MYFWLLLLIFLYYLQGCLSDISKHLNVIQKQNEMAYNIGISQSSLTS